MTNTEMPLLETERLWIRPLRRKDLAAVSQILDEALGFTDGGAQALRGLRERRGWLEWTVRGYRELGQLFQPPYNDRAVVLKSSGEIIGVCGLVPSLGPFGQIGLGEAAPGAMTPEVGLFYAVHPGWQRQGYALEAAQALVNYAFTELHLARVVATTSDDNPASRAVMRRLGMTLRRNPLPEPAWFQWVGVLHNPRYAPRA